MDDKEPKICMTDGSPVAPDHKEIDESTGMQKGYVALCPKERAKGFTRPYRDAYQHKGVQPTHPTRELTPDEQNSFGTEFVLFEVYPDDTPATGRYWTQKELDSGCGGVTTMGSALAETYARDPKFYGGTFCCKCKEHFPVKEFVWVVNGQATEDVVGS